MQQSNTYIIVFSVILTVICALLLSGSSQILGPIQREAEALDTKKQILGAVIEPDEIRAMGSEEISTYYENTISSIVVDIEGNEVAEIEGSPIVAEDVDVEANYKLPPEDRLYPVFIYHEENSDKVISYIFPLYGAGLWNTIWGYLALQPDLNTIEGVTFSHAGETPGLGARITETGVQSRYRGKEIFGEKGELEGVIMQKGEGRDYSNDPHKVDGLSGSTITANGLNRMVVNYLGYYQAYMDNLKSGKSDIVAIR